MRKNDLAPRLRARYVFLGRDDRNPDAKHERRREYDGASASDQRLVTPEAHRPTLVARGFKNKATFESSSTKLQRRIKSGTGGPHRLASHSKLIRFSAQCSVPWPHVGIAWFKKQRSRVTVISTHGHAT